MLPFLKKQRQVGGIITEYRKPDNQDSKSIKDDGLELAAEDMLRAHASNDKKALAAALRAAFEILESEESDQSDVSEK